MYSTINGRPATSYTEEEYCQLCLEFARESCRWLIERLVEEQEERLRRGVQSATVWESSMVRASLSDRIESARKYLRELEERPAETLALAAFYYRGLQRRNS